MNHDREKVKKKYFSNENLFLTNTSVVVESFA